MKVTIEGSEKEIEFKGKAERLIRSLGYMPEEVILVVNGKIVPETTELDGNETVEIIKAIHAG